jgi:hypothetical protein
VRIVHHHERFELSLRLAPASNVLMIELNLTGERPATVALLAPPRWHGRQQRALGRQLAS